MENKALFYTNNPYNTRILLLEEAVQDSNFPVTLNQHAGVKGSLQPLCPAMTGLYDSLCIDVPSHGNKLPKQLQNTRQQKTPVFL